jgi:predicted glycoside hydrolase/deacetylase ChbG (UPF0249 family)
MKRIILCADDYGQNSAISQAIVELLKGKRLSSTSCLVTSPFWAEQAKWLTPLKSHADIGMHFNLTEGKPLSKELPAFFKLKDLILDSNFKGLDPKPIAAEFNAQLDAFANVFGQLPDFIDGHQHVHQFPIIRDVVIKAYEERLRGNGSYIRCTFNKAQLFRVRAELVEKKIPHNNSFSGIYEFSKSFAYSQYFPRFLKQVEDGGVIMCHPGLMSGDEPEEIASARHYEYLYFNSKKYMQEISKNDIMLVKFNAINY